MRVDQNVAAIGKLQEQTPVFCVHNRFWRQYFTSEGGTECLARKLNANFSFEVGNGCAGKRSIDRELRSLLPRGDAAIEQKTEYLQTEPGSHRHGIIHNQHSEMRSEEHTSEL